MFTGFGLVFGLGFLLHSFTTPFPALLVRKAFSQLLLFTCSSESIKS